MPVDVLQHARELAAAGRISDLLGECQRILADPAADVTHLLDIGALLSTYGFLTDARSCYEKAQTIAPEDLRATVNLANLARDAGEHAGARRLYAQLLQALPDHPVIRRNALTSLEYDPEASDAERFAQARAWGAWATTRAGGIRPRPAMQPRVDRPLRVGYVSADFCQHTVGLFVKDVLKAHDARRVQVFAYSAGQVKDWVTDEILAACTLRDVSALDDATLAAQIQADSIDVLVDLSGHTGGSRLSAFAHRPAPVLVSWLGYFATSGLACMDAVLLDDWHSIKGHPLY